MLNGRQKRYETVSLCMLGFDARAALHVFILSILTSHISVCLPLQNERGMVRNIAKFEFLTRWQRSGIIPQRLTSVFAFLWSQ